MAWRPFNWGHRRGLADGPPAERHGCLWGGVSFGPWQAWNQLRTRRPGAQGLDPPEQPEVFLACNRGRLCFLQVKTSTVTGWRFRGSVGLSQESDS
jgi:hypothetical protein